VKDAYGIKSRPTARRKKVYSKIDSQPAGFFKRLGEWLKDLAA